jgi:phage terminase large subunit GpA-like protein
MVTQLHKRPNPFCEAARRAMLPRPELLPIDWAEQNVVVGGDSPVKGPFSRYTMPHLTSVINSIIDPRYQTDVAAASSQSAKSLALNAIPIGYWIEYKRERVIYGVPNRELAVRNWAEKIRPVLMGAPSIAALFPSSGPGSEGGFPDFIELKNGAALMFLTAGSEINQSSATAPRIVIDETNKGADPKKSGKEAISPEQMKRRSDAFQTNRTIIETCTQTTPDGYINVEYESGTKGRPWYRCPNCGGWFYWKWSWQDQMLGWDDDTSEISVEATAYYACPHCGYKLRESDRMLMLYNILWVHEGEEVAQCSPEEVMSRGPFDEGIIIPSAKDVLAFRVTGNRKPTRTVSWWWNRLSCPFPFTTMGLLAAAVWKARESEDLKKAVTIYDMAVPHEGRLSDRSATTKEAILSRLKHSRYKSAAVPGSRMPFVWDPHHFIVTGGIDVQKRELYAFFDAWQVDDTRHLIASWRLLMLLPYHLPDPDASYAIYKGLEAIREIIRPGFTDANGNVFKPNAVGIDTGYQGDKQTNRRIVGGADLQVYEFCKRYGQGFWRAVKGQMGQSTLNGHVCVLSETMKKQGIGLWLVDSDECKLEIHDQLRIEFGQPGFWWLPEDTIKGYAQGLAAEKRDVLIDPLTNKEQAAWVILDRFNHPLDAEVYNWAMARSFGVLPPSATPPPPAQPPERK